MLLQDHRQSGEETPSVRGHPHWKVQPQPLRVIILTPSIEDECDDSNESSRYFLEIPYSRNEGQLMSYVHLLNDVITKNQRKEDLHEELEDEVLHRQHNDLL